MTARSRDNRDIYDARYTHDHLRIDGPMAMYDRQMVQIRLDYLRELAVDRVVVDLGCGTGAYLLPAATVAKVAYGIDYSDRLIQTARERATGVANVHLIHADIRALPLPDASVDLVFSIATLYTVPDIDHVFTEIARVLRHGGRGLLELGNLWSINTIVNRSHPLGIRSHHIPVAKMLSLMRANQLQVDEHRVFQLLPMWGGPRYLWPLATARWKTIMGIRIAGRMLDEHLSSAPLLDRIAFRHTFVVTRA